MLSLRARSRETKDYDMLLPETKARFAEWKNQVIAQGREEWRKEGRKEGLTKGRVEGRKEGRKEGLTKGRAEGERALFLKMLVLRFGKLPAAAERRVKRASIPALEQWAERLLTAKTLNEVFEH